MKALSIRQPWAWLICGGHKDVENRSWDTPFRGEFLIHAGKRFDREGYEWVASHMNVELPEPHEFEKGGIVGRATLVDVVTEHDSPWFFGPYGFLVEVAQPLEFLPLRGRLRFFNAEYPTL